MNRLQSFWPEMPSDSHEPATLVEQGRIQDGPSAAHALFVPLHYERNYAYPLIVWLHGPNDDQRQLKRIMPFVSLRNYVAVGPRGSVLLSPEASGESPLPAAGEIDGEVEPLANLSGYGWSQDPDHILLAEHRVMAAVAAVRRTLNVASHRIFAAGFGCGGTMAFRLALSMPQVFAGALSLGGSFPTGGMPLARLHEARKQKFLLASGRDSHRFPPDQVCQNLRLLYSAGMSISLRQYPCGDDLTTNMLGDMDRWIMEQITAPVAASHDHAQQTGGES